MPVSESAASAKLPTRSALEGTEISPVSMPWVVRVRLIVGEEELSCRSIRPPDRAAGLVLFERRPFRRKIVAGVQVRIARRNSNEIAVKRIASRLW